MCGLVVISRYVNKNNNQKRNNSFIFLSDKHSVLTLNVKRAFVFFTEPLYIEAAIPRKI